MKHSPEQRAEKRYPDHTRKELEILSMVPDAVYEAGVSIGIRRSVCATTIREEVEPLELKVQEQADEVAKLRALVQAGDAMAVQLRHIAEEYRNTMSMRGGSSDIHPLHAEALTTWDAAKSNPPLDIPEAIKAFEFIKEIGERGEGHGSLRSRIISMVKWANHGLEALTTIQNPT